MPENQCGVSEVRCLNQASQMQVPFDYAQGRHSTQFGAKSAPNIAQDDSAF
jgi:hypothetical protein